MNLGVYKSSNFAPAFFFLPPERRRALKAVYAFCREVDDAVDNVLDAPATDPGFARARAVLENWRTTLKGGQAPVDADLWARLREACVAYGIDRKHLLALVDGVAMDIDGRRYETFDDLKLYCHGVAGTVGLACLPVFGLSEADHALFAIHLGLAVQLTNILRDVKADAERDRVYLPQEDLRRFGYGEDALFRDAHDDNFVRLMAFEAARAREHFGLARRHLPPSSRRLARPALVMGAVYENLLNRLQAENFRVFGPRVRLSAWRKFLSVAGVLKDEWT